MGTNGFRVFASLFLGAQVVVPLTVAALPSTWMAAILGTDGDFAASIFLGFSFALCGIGASLTTLVSLPRFPRCVAGMGLVTAGILVALVGLGKLFGGSDITLPLVTGVALLAWTTALAGVLAATSWCWELKVVRGNDALLATTRPQFQLWQLLATVTAVAVLLGIGRWFLAGINFATYENRSMSALTITFAVLVVFASMVTLLTLLGWLTPRYLFLMVPITFLVALAAALLEWPALDFARSNTAPMNNDGMWFMLTLNGVQYAWFSLSLLSARLAGFRLVAGRSQ